MKKTMKNIWKSLFVAALFVSCSEQMAEETVAPEVNNGKAIQFEVVEDGGRAAFFQGEGHGVVLEGDEILGIRHFAGETMEDAKSSNNLDVYIQRGNYKMQDGVWTMYETGTWQDVSWVDGLENTICAFILPVRSANRYANLIKDAVLSGEQVQAKANDHSHIDDYMVMSSDPQKFAANNHPE